MSYSKHPLSILAYVGLALALVAILLPWVGVPEELAAAAGEINAAVQPRAMIIGEIALIVFAFVFFASREASRAMAVVGLIVSIRGIMFVVEQHIPAGSSGLTGSGIGFYLALAGTVALAISCFGGMFFFKK